MGIEDLTKNMDKFEDQFETLDLQAEYMDQAIGNVGVNQMPEGDVEELMSQIADENNIDLEGQLCEADPLRKQVAKAKDEEVDEEDDLAKRLANLQGI
jgi:charged multivesicular body protein 1